MALQITEECINCGACEPVCPNNAIYEGSAGWRFSDKTALNGNISTLAGISFDANAEQPALSNDFYYLVADKCTECKGFHDEPQCVSECPVDCIVPVEGNSEDEASLLAKKTWLHGN